ncbi:MAG TPA: sigma-70 family RNA polymerase sigma factor [Kineosporiaceae bacterium]|nr:sigma-70 family RNA polymerase sigma factor [Kineosporiaceae bacterium]
MSIAEGQRELDDRELMTAVREGRSENFAHLYHRHSAAAAAYARRLVRQGADEHDVVAEAFLRVFGILSRGLGPQDSFRPYLLRAVRNAAYDRTRAERRLELTDEISVLEGVEPFRDTAVERFDRELVVQAFRQLPARWQKVLLLTVIEELPVDEAAERLGINTNSLTSLAYRAREGLRQAYLRISLATGSSPVCRKFADPMIRFVRGTAAPTDRRLVEEHLSACGDCGSRIRELSETDAVLWSRSAVLVLAPQAASEHHQRRRRATPGRIDRCRGLERDYGVPA